MVAALLVALRGGSAGLSGSMWRGSRERHHHRGPKLVEAVAELADDTRAKALIVAIDSPGGSVAGGQAFHDAIARVARRSRSLR